MKIKLIALFALSTIICLSCCKKNVNTAPPSLEGNNAVILRLDLPSTESSRASIEAPITSTVVPGLNKVDIYLYAKVSGIIYTIMSLDNAQLAKASTEGGLQITNLHANVSAVAVICNDTPAKGLNTLASTNMRKLFEKEVNITLEQDFNNLTYVGRDEDIVQTNTPEGGSDDIDYFNATVVVAPLVARVEISNIAVTDYDYEATNPYIFLLSTYLEDIYKDGIRLDYSYEPELSNPNTHIALESEIESATQYWWQEVLEAPNTELDASLTTVPWSPKYDVPAVDGVFAFHIFERPASVPTIGLYLRAFTVDGVENILQYARFRTYSTASGNIASFQAGHIYKITPHFTLTDMKDFDDDPGEINLSITVQEWTIHNEIIATS